MLTKYELVGTLHGSQSPLVCECVCIFQNDNQTVDMAIKGLIFVCKAGP